MHRVVVKHFDQCGSWTVEAGPWHVLRSDAEAWAERLRQMGYNTEIETLHGGIGVAPGQDHGLHGAAKMG